MSGARKPGGAEQAAIGALLVSNAVLACGPWLVRMAESEAQVGPIGSAFWRLALSLPILLVATAARPAERRALSASALALAGLAGLLFAADLALWHLGIMRTRLANATLLGNITAILFPAYGFLASRRRPTLQQGFALLFASAGALLLVGHSYRLLPGNTAGDLLCIAAGVCYTAYLIAIERVRLRLGPIATLAGAVCAGTPALLCVAVLVEGHLWPHAWSPLILLALGSQLVGQGLILWAVSRVQPLVVGIMLLTQPVIAAAIGWVIFQERLGLLDLLGGAAIASAVLLVRNTPPRSDRTRTEGIDHD